MAFSCDRNNNQSEEEVMSAMSHLCHFILQTLHVLGSVSQLGQVRFSPSLLLFYLLSQLFFCVVALVSGRGPNGEGIYFVEKEGGGEGVSGGVSGGEG